MPTKPWSITAEANARPMTPWGCGPAMRTAWRYMDMTACCDRVAAFGASSCTAGGRGDVWEGVEIVEGQGRPTRELVGTAYSTLPPTLTCLRNPTKSAGVGTCLMSNSEEYSTSTAS